VCTCLAIFVAILVWQEVFVLEYEELVRWIKKDLSKDGDMVGATGRTGKMLHRPNGAKEPKMLFDYESLCETDQKDKEVGLDGIERIREKQHRQE